MSVEAPEHDVVFGQLTITVKLAEPQPCDGPKLYALANARPPMMADRATLTYHRDPERGWVAMEMAASGTAVDPEHSTATLRRAWNRAAPDLPPPWLSALMRTHRPEEAS